MTELQKIESYLQDAHAALQFWCANDEVEPDCVTEALDHLNAALEAVRASLLNASKPGDGL